MREWVRPWRASSDTIRHAEPDSASSALCELLPEIFVEFAGSQNIPWPLLVIGAVVVSGYLAYSIGADSYARPSEPSFVAAGDEAIVNRASDIYGAGKVSRDALRKSNDISVVYLPTMTFVGFNALPGTAGGDDTICLDKSGQHVVLTYRDGQ